jgi:hypothetical protein
MDSTIEIRRVIHPTRPSPPAGRDSHFASRALRDDFPIPGSEEPPIPRPFPRSGGKGAQKGRLVQKLLRDAGSWALAAGVTCTLAFPAMAEPTSQDKAAAQALFDEGRVAIQAEQVSLACGKFGESYRLDPSDGTLINLGLCHEKEGRTASAYTELNESVSRAIRDQRPERERVAREHLALITPRLSRLTIDVAAGSEVEGLVVTVDGSPMAKVAWGIAVPVDPGDHVIEAKAPRMLSFRTAVKLGAERDAARVEVPRLLSDPAAPPLAVMPLPVTPLPVTPLPVTPLPVTPPVVGSKGSVQRTSAWLVIGLGGAGVAVGSVFGLLAIGRWSGASSECPGGVCKSATDKANFAGASTFADVSTVGFVAGGIALATGAVLLITAPRALSPTGAWRLAPMFGPGTAGLHLEGSL